MPRRSAVSRATRPLEVAGGPGRLLPEAGLPDDVRTIFEATVAAAAPGHFSEIDRVCLTEFAQSAARCRRAEAAIATEGDIVSGKPNAWLLVLRDARHQVTNLLPKLRLCPSARLQAKQVREADSGRAVADSLLRQFR